MTELNRYQKAALISNKKSKENALKKYYENPKVCKFCNNIIHVKPNQKPGETRRKTFCNHSCATSYCNLQKPPKEIIKKETIKKEKFEFILSLTKKDLIDKHGVYYKFRAVVRKHAHYVFNKHNKHKKCLICGYDTHVEVCHIKSVSSYDENALISEINNINNLVGLCPNHHWEYDNGLIQI